MINKQEFYGAYLIKAVKEVSDGKTIHDLFKEINPAWIIVDELQQKGPIVGKISEGFKIPHPDTYTRDTSVEFTFQADDNAEEPKPGKWPELKGTGSNEKIEGIIEKIDPVFYYKTKSFFTEEAES